MDNSDPLHGISNECTFFFAFRLLEIAFPTTQILFFSGEHVPGPRHLSPKITSSPLSSTAESRHTEFF
jgi:hypothetical protein